MVINFGNILLIRHSSKTRYQNIQETISITDNDLWEIFLKFQKKEIFFEILTRIIYWSILEMKCDIIIQVWNYTNLDSMS